MIVCVKTRQRSRSAVSTDFSTSELLLLLLPPPPPLLLLLFLLPPSLLLLLLLPLLLLLLLLLPLQQADLLDKKRPNDISEQDKNQTARTSSTVRYGFLSS